MCTCVKYCNLKILSHNPVTYFKINKYILKKLNRYDTAKYVLTFKIDNKSTHSDIYVDNKKLPLQKAERKFSMLYVCKKWTTHAGIVSTCKIFR